MIDVWALVQYRKEESAEKERKEKKGIVAPLSVYEVEGRSRRTGGRADGGQAVYLYAFGSYVSGNAER